MQPAVETDHSVTQLTGLPVTVAEVGVSHAAVLEALHAACFSADEQLGWTQSGFADILARPGGFAVIASLDARDSEPVLSDAPAPVGYAVAWVIDAEAELLSLGVVPSARSRGIGHALVRAIARSACARGAQTLHLEVADDRARAIQLYRTAGFEQTGRRPRYYQRGRGSVDALAMRLDLDD